MNYNHFQKNKLQASPNKYSQGHVACAHFSATFIYFESVSIAEEEGRGGERKGVRGAYFSSNMNKFANMSYQQELLKS